MSFFRGLKRALGWSGDNEDEDDYITYETPSKDEQPEAEKKDIVVEFNDTNEIPEGVFDGLIEIVNSNLSPMVLKCLDVEAEKKYLYEALGPKFSAFIKETKEKSLSVARVEWEREKATMNSAIEDYKARCETAEKDMNDMKAVKMSEDRQKAALKERIRNLEDKVATAEAEKEQYDLENKSLLNKLKVSQVKNAAIEESEKEIQELTAQVVALKKEIAEGGADDEKIKALEEEYKSKMEINNALINEILAEAAKNKEALGEKEKELGELKSELEAAKAELGEMTENMGLLDDIQEQLKKVEEFKKKKEEEIAELNIKVSELQKEKDDIQSQFSEQKQLVEKQKLELEESISLKEKAEEEIKYLKSVHMDEICTLKAIDLDKTQRFQAEIAELQAKLNVNGKIDDFLVEDDLRQAVEETFDVSLDDTDFVEFVSPVAVAEPKKQDIVAKEDVAEDTDVQIEEVEAELDDIDWLLPDTVESVIKEETKKKEKEPELEPEKAEPESDTQMSLFG